MMLLTCDLWAEVVVGPRCWRRGGNRQPFSLDVASFFQVSRVEKQRKKHISNALLVGSVRIGGNPRQPWSFAASGARQNRRSKVCALKNGQTGGRGCVVAPPQTL